MKSIFIALLFLILVLPFSSLAQNEVVAIDQAAPLYTNTTSSVDNTPLEDQAQIAQITVFPDPDYLKFQIVLENSFEGELHLALINPEGKRIKLSKFLKNQYDFKVDFKWNKIPRGSYYVELKGKGKLITKQLVYLN